MVVATVVLFYVSYWLLSQDGSGEVEPLREEQGAGRASPAAPRSRSRRRRSSRCTAKGSRRCCSTRRCSSRPARARRPRRCVGGMLAGGRAPGRRLHRDQPVRRAAAAQAVLRGDQRVPLLHGVRVRGQRHRRAAGRRVRVPDARVASAPARSPGARHLSRPSSRCSPRVVLVVLALVGAGVDLRDRAAGRAIAGPSGGRSGEAVGDDRPTPGSLRPLRRPGPGRGAAVPGLRRRAGVRRRRSRPCGSSRTTRWCASRWRAGAGRVLVVDGGGSLRCALVGGRLAALAPTNGWAGIVVNGCVRDVGRDRATTPLGVKALAACPAPQRQDRRGRAGRAGDVRRGHLPARSSCCAETRTAWSWPTRD